MSKNIVGLADGNVLSADYVVDENGLKITTAMLNLIYPIGSIYMSVNDVDPSILFGGKWEKLEDRFLLGSGNEKVGAVGGSTSHSHALGDDSYVIMANYDTTLIFSTNNRHRLNTISAPMFYYWEHGHDAEWGTDSPHYNDASAISLGGQTDSTNVYPPYLVVNMWKRTE